MSGPITRLAVGVRIDDDTIAIRCATCRDQWGERDAVDGAWSRVYAEVEAHNARVHPVPTEKETEMTETHPEPSMALADDPEIAGPTAANPTFDGTELQEPPLTAPVKPKKTGLKRVSGVWVVYAHPKGRGDGGIAVAGSLHAEEVPALREVAQSNGTRGFAFVPWGSSLAEVLAETATADDEPRPETRPANG